MSDPSSFFPNKALLWTASDICGDFPPEVDVTVCGGDTILHNKRQQSDVIQSFSVTSTRGRRQAYLLHVRNLDMEMPPDTLESVRVNELFVAVTVDVSFTTEQTVVGLIDEIHLLNAVRTSPIVGYLSPSRICDSCDVVASEKTGHGDDSRSS